MPRKKSVDVPATPPPALKAVPKRRSDEAAKSKSKTIQAVTSQAPTFEEIAAAAYLRFLGRGAGHGSDFEDWVEAERELSIRRGLAKAG